ncbi:PEPxxWA-CTERM sorting domain-containing protein [Phenylobacterium sp. RIFCSPHIGHO2_01_FULL_69_31]|uniref:PEPxxWA-CTERM sorting domain-containing protein n=1 Tax=Phenylobacterium sp. RIFCSPHIGHO2_01_FULL_69_31 TaxID=1801944 RepID=UPI000A592629|nr:PEPxxWA-CTERM sorting domain-containing protein [Phenylobacterium sp. RIFCSPHIGHO2_01_FULL_69_31]
MSGMHRNLGLAVACAVIAGPAAAAVVEIYPPKYSEAVYGTPDAPLAWSTGPFVGVTDLFYRSNLHDARIVTFDLANAAPGARVDWWGQLAGFVGDDGTFSLSAPIFPLTDSYDRQYAGRVRVGFKVGLNHLDSVPYDIVRMEVMGSKPIAAPEPTTWALMLLGFGAVGAVARRNRIEPAAT